ncbi:MAG: hypothetical protein M1832_005202 [Thelocarpon impressellum]|nr:MAG: hypothetical protein M1832_005202 [Thelocarpon impressellum]
MALRSPAHSGSSSPLSSLASRSPSPPAFYPSPTSSQEPCEASLPASQQFSQLDAADGDRPPPSKKRKIVVPKPRTTEYLDLRAPSLKAGQPTEGLSSSQRTHLDALLKVLRKKRKIVVVAGAGISVSAGIPDFRSSTGLFTTLRSQHNLKASGKHLFDASVYKTDESTSSFHDMVRSLSHLVSATKPTEFHHLLATLAQEGRLLRLYSQNVDGIDTSLPPLVTKVPLNSKGPWPRTIQLHGGLGKMVCQKCHHLSDFEAALFDGPHPPSCRECEEMDSVRTNIAGKRSHGIGKLRPRIVLYNEYNPDEDAIGAVSSADLRARPDAIIVVGTSLKVPGVRRIVKEMCGVVRGRRDGVAIWINNGPEPMSRDFDNCWDLVVRGDADEVARHAKLGRWDDNEPGEYQEVPDAALMQVKEEGDRLEVVVGTPKKSTANLANGVLTPVGSPYSGATVMAEKEAEMGKPTKRAKIEKPSGLLRDLLEASRKPSKQAPKRTKKPDKKALKPSRTSTISRALKVTKSTTLTVTEESIVTAKAKLTEENGLPYRAAASDPVATSKPPMVIWATSRPSLPQGSFRLAECNPITPPDDQMAAIRRAMRDAVVSPTGPIPQGMEFLMNR